MAAITKPAIREIIDDFAKEIRERRVQGAKPQLAVINFRNERPDGIERIVWKVPIEILRFRKDNGRIASDVMDYEHNTGLLHERDEYAQKLIGGFLEEKDRQKTEVLYQSILHAGQSDPAIITCDGFLINGNRRKMVMEKLHVDHPGNDAFAYMKCVILPGKDEEGGPPTLLEIEKVENRYQLQNEGKSEYYGFDRALSIKRKIDLVGLSLRDQLKDDPQFSNATESALEKACAEYEKSYLDPLKCVDRYLAQFRREGQYRTIATGTSDPQGRWQAFIDYSNKYNQFFRNAGLLSKNNIDEDDVGTIEEAAFDIIRLRVIPGLPKVHEIMRRLPKYCSNRDAKKEILKLAEEVSPVLPESECVDDKGKYLTTAELDRKWETQNSRPIIHRMTKVDKNYESQKEKETPLGLLEAAYKKLTHDDMDISQIVSTELTKAHQTVAAIRERAAEIESDIYHLQKARKKLLREDS